MKLPKGYKNWIEFAGKCIELQAKYSYSPGIETTICIHEDLSEPEFIKFTVSEVKAKAFDELISKGVDFDILDVIKEYNITDRYHLIDILNYANKTYSTRS